MQAYRGAHPEALPWSDAAVLAEVHRGHARALQVADQQGDWSVVDPWLPDLMTCVRVRVDPGSDVYQQLRHELFVQYQSVTHALQLRDEGVYVETPAPSNRFVPLLMPPTRDEAMRASSSASTWPANGAKSPSLPAPIASVPSSARAGEVADAVCGPTLDEPVTAGAKTSSGNPKTK